MNYLFKKCLCLLFFIFLNFFKLYSEDLVIKDHYQDNILLENKSVNLISRKQKIKNVFEDIKNRFSKLSKIKKASLVTFISGTTAYLIFYNFFKKDEVLKKDKVDDSYFVSKEFESDLTQAIDYKNKVQEYIKNKNARDGSSMVTSEEHIKNLGLMLHYKDKLKRNLPQN